jgi:hypothetical protein
MDFLSFTIDDQYIGLEWALDGYADLHNNFDFTDLHYFPTEARLIMCWKKSAGDWVPNVLWQTLKLVFEGVSYLQVRERNPEFPISDDNCMRDICRTPVEARQDFDSIWLDRTPPSDYDLQLAFQSEWAIKVNATTVALNIEP